ncbi:MAG: glycosyltransferase [Breznakibacter sp.]
MDGKHTILVCPLDWGLGHASRCIPIINHYLEQGDRVVVAGYGQSLQLLKNEFPSLGFFHMKGFCVTYTPHKQLWRKLMWQLPNFLWHTFREHWETKRLVKQIAPQLIISDNRYGVRHPHVKSVIITHQLNPQIPQWLSPIGKIASLVLHFWIIRFDECWVPDFKDRRISGRLSEPLFPNPKIKYVGPLSRFAKAESFKQNNTQANKEALIVSGLEKPFIIAVASGPDPQRTIFTDILKRQLPRLRLPAILVLGTPSEAFAVQQTGRLSIVPHLPTNQMENLLRRCEMVICRSGYSSVMDLCAMGSKAILIPTPGQSEQEYLAKHLWESGLFYTVNQSKINLQADIHEAVRFYQIAKRAEMP